MLVGMPAQTMNWHRSMKKGSDRRNGRKEGRKEGGPPPPLASMYVVFFSTGILGTGTGTGDGGGVTMMFRRIPKAAALKSRGKEGAREASVLGAEIDLLTALQLQQKTSARGGLNEANARPGGAKKESRSRNFTQTLVISSYQHNVIVDPRDSTPTPTPSLHAVTRRFNPPPKDQSHTKQARSSAEERV